MRVFITGASGFIGSAVTAELIDAGHHVIGLSRSESGDKLLTRLGAETLRSLIWTVWLAEPKRQMR